MLRLVCKLYIGSAATKGFASPLLTTIGVAGIFDLGGITTHFQWRHQKFLYEEVFMWQRLS